MTSPAAMTPMMPQQSRPSPMPGRSAAAANSPGAMQRAARDFEAQALSALLQPMFSGISTHGPFGGGAAEDQWRPMLVEHMSRGIANAGGLGLANAVYRELLRRASGQQAGDMPAGE